MVSSFEECFRESGRDIRYEWIEEKKYFHDRIGEHIFSMGTFFFFDFICLECEIREFICDRVKELISKNSKFIVSKSGILSLFEI